MKKNGGNFEDDNTDVINLVSNVFAHTFKETYFHTFGGTEIESKKFVPQVSKFMRVLISRGGDLSTNFDETTEQKIYKTSLKEVLHDNHRKQANK